MRWTQRTALGATLAAAVVAVAAVSCSRQEAPTTQQAAMSDVERGRYLTWVAGCQDCHTPGALYGFPDTTRQLSGSEIGWQGPWGVSFPRNLTPDSATGIGSWTEADIERALRQGQRPDGSPILPPMPWPNFARMTPEDMRAVIAFLRSIPPVSHPVPERVPPGQTRAGVAALVFPAPPAWDAQGLPPPGAAPGDTAGRP